MSFGFVGCWENVLCKKIARSDITNLHTVTRADYNVKQGVLRMNGKSETKRDNECNSRFVSLDQRHTTV